MTKYKMYIIDLIYIFLLCLFYWLGECQYDVIFFIAGILVMIIVQGVLYARNNQ